MASQGEYKQSRYDLINRSRKGTSNPGLITFIGLRLIDPILQYNLLANGWAASLLSKLGLAIVVPGGHTGVAAIDRFGLSVPQLIVLAMSVGSVAKQIFWAAYLNNEFFAPKPAAIVAAANLLFNSLNSILLTWAATSAALYAGSPSWVRIPGVRLGAALPLPVAVGALLYTVGLATEWVAEVQRKKFKDNPANKGKVCNEGLWSAARHINYGGYAVWRMGYCLASGGLIAALTVGLQSVYDFTSRSIPVLNEYMTSRYGDQWAKYQRDVPYKLIPGVW